MVEAIHLLVADAEVALPVELVTVLHSLEVLEEDHEVHTKVDVDQALLHDTLIQVHDMEVLLHHQHQEEVVAAQVAMVQLLVVEHHQAIIVHTHHQAHL